MTTYRIRINNDYQDRVYRSERAAIQAAKRLDVDGDDVRVVMHEQSGTYKSTTVIWPEVGTTYTN